MKLTTIAAQRRFGSLGSFCGVAIAFAVFQFVVFQIPIVLVPFTESLRAPIEQVEVDRIHVREPPPYLIEEARQRAVTYDEWTLKTKEADANLAFDHPAFKTTKEAYKRDPNWSKVLYPDIAIIGLPKAGTSQLYNILTGHPDLTKFHPQVKEYCFDFQHAANATGSPEEVQETFDGIAKRMNYTMHKSSKKTVNACLDVAKALLMRQYLNRTNSSKLILLLRDPADWLWAGYNFWHRPEHHDAVAAFDYGWAEQPYQYRSPELFHEMLLAGNRLWPSVELLSYFRDKLNAMRVRVAAILRSFSPESILILKTEDMAPDMVEISGFLDRLAEFVEVPKDGFNQSTYGSFSNCGNKRGLGTLCQKSSSAYRVAGNRSMLPESRELVYLHFAEECYFWKRRLGIEYSDCLAVREKYVGPNL